MVGEHGHLPDAEAVDTLADPPGGQLDRDGFLPAAQELAGVDFSAAGDAKALAANRKKQREKGMLYLRPGIKGAVRPPARACLYLRRKVRFCPYLYRKERPCGLFPPRFCEAGGERSHA